MRALLFAVTLIWSALLHAADVSQPHILVEAQVIFALVQRADSPGGDSLEVLPGLFAVADATTVDRIIESESDHALVTPCRRDYVT